MINSTTSWGTAWMIFGGAILFFIFGTIFIALIDKMDLWLLVMGLTLCIIIAGFIKVDKAATEDRETPIQSEEVLNEEYELVSLSDGTAMSGGGNFIGWVIAEKGVYRYYYKLEDGGFMQDSISADGVKVYYITDGSKPRLIRTSTHTYKVRPGEGVFGGKKFDQHWTNNGWELYVPEGSIVSAFDLDLGNT